MKKFFKFLLYFFLIVIISGLVFFVYIYFKPSAKHNIYQAIPDDAIFAIASKNATGGWQKIAVNHIWLHLLKSETFADINQQALTLDTLIQEHKIFRELFKDRYLVISAHLLRNSDYDFLFSLDMKQASKITFFIDYLHNKILNYFDYRMEQTSYNNQTIYSLIDNASPNDILYFTFSGNIFSGSYSRKLVENAIVCFEKNCLANKKNFDAFAPKYQNNDFALFVFYPFIDEFVSEYAQDSDELMKPLSEALDFTCAGLDFTQQQITLSGITLINDSINSYLKILSQLQPAQRQAEKILSHQTAFYLSMCFSNFTDFYNKLVVQYQDADSTGYSNIKINQRRLERFLGINLDEDFFGWIGNEIAFAKLRPKGVNDKDDDMLICMHSHNIENAKLGLSKIMKHIKNRTPVKFKNIAYLNYDIHYLHIKGFFKMFFGKLFGQLEKPYFTIIGDYVIFSNSPHQLTRIIDDFVNGRTLKNSNNFEAFNKLFNQKSTISCFIQMPKLYSHLIYYAQADDKNAIKKNKEVILSFANVGFQLTARDKQFETMLISAFDSLALVNDEEEQFEIAADDLQIALFQNHFFAINPEQEEIKRDSAEYVCFYYEDQTLKHIGAFKNNQLHGSWKSFYQNGNMMMEANYDESQLSGIATLYYMEQPEQKLAEALYKKNMLHDEYREYYPNGALKAVIAIKNNKPDGKAIYYYSNGKLFMEGKFVDGRKKGQWKYYLENGQLFDKERKKKKSKS